MPYINGKYTETNPPEELDYEEHEDGICDPQMNDYLLNRNYAHIWENGYQLEVQDGCWYELYLKDRAHGSAPKSEENLSTKEQELIQLISSLYKGSDLGYFSDQGQITFYVSDKEELLDEDLLLSSFEKINIKDLSSDVLARLKNLQIAIDKHKNNDNDSIQDHSVLIDQIANSEIEFHEINEEDKNNREFILELVKAHHFSFMHIPDKFKDDKEITLNAVTGSAYHLEVASDAMKSDKEVVLVAVRAFGSSLEYASEELKNDREVILASLGDAYSGFDHAPDELKSDREFFLSVIKKAPSYYKYLSLELKSDREIALLAARNSVNGFLDAPEEFKSDKDFIIEALQPSDNLNGRLIEFIPDGLKEDREIVSMALKKSNGSAFEFASEELRNDTEYFLQMPLLGLAYEYAGEGIKSDKEILLRIFEEGNIHSLEYASNELRADKEIVMKAIGIQPWALTLADEKLHNDEDLIAAGGIVELE
ncbi:MAG: hypothetical protein CBE29_00490 [Rickettsiales bacterium TMED269]|nr:hypothetical protein [Gammaproteobacteria bacterium]OUX40984.1 MAG: hypothetical protein CBE29_00490 [Rickettsiales bacterium TMED269]